jgi:hypothetical protein
MRVGLVVVCCLCVSAGIAAADEPPAREGAGWTVYEDAFDALEVGDRDRARELLRVLVATHPDAPAGQKAKALLAEMDVAPGASVDETLRGDVAPPPPVKGEHPTSSARAELAIVQMVNGIAAGTELCVMGGCNDATPVIGLALVGGVAGVGVSLAFTKHGLRPGARASYNSGVVWGVANAGAILILAEPDDEVAIGGGLLLGQGLGLVLGAAVDSMHPTAGQVALANTAGTWAAALGGGVYVALNDEADADGFVATLLVLGDLGVGAGAALAHAFPEVSRARTLVIDAGGLVGGLVGAGGAILVSGDSGEKTTAALAVAGAAIGLGTSAYFTRHWDDPHVEPAVRAAIAPTRGGAMATIGVDF